MQTTTFNHIFPSGKSATGLRCDNGKTETIENQDELHEYSTSGNSVTEKVFSKRGVKKILVSHQNVSRTNNGSVRIENLLVT